MQIQIKVIEQVERTIQLTLELNQDKFIAWKAVNIAQLEAFVDDCLEQYYSETKSEDFKVVDVVGIEEKGVSFESSDLEILNFDVTK